MTTKTEQLCADIADLESRRAADLTKLRELRAQLNKTLKGGGSRD